MQFTTRSGPFAKALAANSTDLAFPSRIPTTTTPADAGVLSLVINTDGGVTHDRMLVIPYGVGNDNLTFSVRIIGWRLISTLWVPCILTELACTMSAAVGITGAAVVATERFADTITLVTNMGNANVDVVITSPANDTPAHAVINLKGCQKVEFTFDMTGATSANCLRATL